MQEEEITLVWIDNLHLQLLPKNKRCSFKAFLILDSLTVQSPWKHTAVEVPIEKLRRALSPSRNANEKPSIFPFSAILITPINPNPLPETFPVLKLDFYAHALKIKNNFYFFQLNSQNFL